MSLKLPHRKFVMGIKGVKYLIILNLYIAILFKPFSTQAEYNFIKWPSTNIQLLKSWGYKIAEDSRLVMTVELISERMQKFNKLRKNPPNVYRQVRKAIPVTGTL